jgi:hypothetical protein
VSAPDFEAPLDADGNNTYVVAIAASDGSLTSSQTITVNVTNGIEPGETTRGTPGDDSYTVDTGNARFDAGLFGTPMNLHPTSRAKRIRLGRHLSDRFQRHVP